MSILVKLIDEYDPNVDANPRVFNAGDNFFCITIDARFNIKDDYKRIVNSLNVKSYEFLSGSLFYQKKPSFDIEINNCYLDRPFMLEVQNLVGKYQPVIKFNNCVFGNNFRNKNEVYFNIYENCEWGAAL